MLSALSLSAPPPRRTDCLEAALESACRAGLFRWLGMALCVGLRVLMFEDATRLVEGEGGVAEPACHVGRCPLRPLESPHPRASITNRLCAAIG